MKTASGSAPAASLTVGAGDDGATVQLSQREAGRRSGHDPKVLREAIAAELLHLDEAGKITVAELERFMASLGKCRYFGCDKPARYPSGCCSKGHAIAVAKETTQWRQCERLLSRPDLKNPDCEEWFRPRPELLEAGMGECCSPKCGQLLRRAREEEAGKLRGVRVFCKCGCGESRLVFPSQRTAPPNSKPGYVAPYEYLNAGHWARHRWKHGIALTNNVRGFYRRGNWSLKKLRQVLGAWAGKTGGRPSVEDVLGTVEVAAIRQLRADHPDWGYGTIAAARSAVRADELVTLDRVRTILAGH